MSLIQSISKHRLKTFSATQRHLKLACWKRCHGHNAHHIAVVPFPNSCYYHYHCFSTQRKVDSQGTDRSLGECEGRGTGTGSESDTGSLLIVSPTLWPEPDASAAGVRTSSLLNYFTRKDGHCSASLPLFNSVHYGCGLPPLLQNKQNHDNGIESEFDSKHDKNGVDKKNIAHKLFPKVTMHHIPPPNKSFEMKTFLDSEPMDDLQAIIFDRHFAEEMYSFHFYNHKPNVLRILDMQDVHFIRKHRQSVIMEYDKKKNRHSSRGEQKDSFMLSSSLMEKVISSYPILHAVDNEEELEEEGGGQNEAKEKSEISSNAKRDQFNSTLLRELASIHRSDLTLVCSPYELALLRDEYGIPPHKLTLASFFIDQVEDKYFSSSSSPSSSTSAIINPTEFSFEQRSNFVVLGGFKHAPNIDQVKVLKYHLWPDIRKQIPHAKLYVYGAYAPQSILQLHNEAEGFIVKGYIPDVKDILPHCRVMLAPLRFGAGIKGKIIDSWKYGCPVVTTPIGSEGMTVKTTVVDNDHDEHEETKKWGGIVASNSHDFVQGAVNLYNNEKQWMICQTEGRKLIQELFDAEQNLECLNDNIKLALENKIKRRQRDYFSASLWNQQSRSTEYFSKWIEQKEMNKSLMKTRNDTSGIIK